MLSSKLQQKGATATAAAAAGGGGGGISIPLRLSSATAVPQRMLVPIKMSSSSPSVISTSASKKRPFSAISVDEGCSSSSSSSSSGDNDLDLPLQTKPKRAHTADSNAAAAGDGLGGGGMTESVLYQEHMHMTMQSSDLQDRLNKLKRNFQAASKSSSSSSPSSAPPSLSTSVEDSDKWPKLNRKFSITSNGKYPYMTSQHKPPTKADHERSKSMIQSVKHHMKKAGGGGVRGAAKKPINLSTPLYDIAPNLERLRGMIASSRQGSDSSLYESTKKLLVDTIAPSEEDLMSLVYCMMMDSQLRPTNNCAVVVSDSQLPPQERPVPYYRWRLENYNGSEPGASPTPDDIDELERWFEEKMLLREPVKKLGEPSCVNKQNCQGMAVIVNNRRVARAYMSMREYRAGKWTAGAGRPCLLCMRNEASKAYGAALGGMASLNINTHLITHICNITEAAGEYDIRECLWNLPDFFLGLYGPIVSHNVHAYCTREGTAVINDREYDGVVFFDQLYIRPGTNPEEDYRVIVEADQTDDEKSAAPPTKADFQ